MRARELLLDLGKAVPQPGGLLSGDARAALEPLDRALQARDAPGETYHVAVSRGSRAMLWHDAPCRAAGWLWSYRDAVQRGDL